MRPILILIYVSLIAMCAAACSAKKEPQLPFYTHPGTKEVGPKPGAFFFYQPYYCEDGEIHESTLKNQTYEWCAPASEQP